jgi:hypothetical protein
MRCVITTCRREGSRPLSITCNVHEVLCSACWRAWLASTDFRQALQFVALDKLGDAINQYRNWQSSQALELRRAA